MPLKAGGITEVDAIEFGETRFDIATKYHVAVTVESGDELEELI